MKKIKKMGFNVIQNLLGNLNSKKYWDKKLERKKSWENRNTIYEELKKVIPEGTQSLLDIGCSLGDGCIALKKIFPKVVIEGCDFSEVGIEEAKKKANNVHFYLLDIMKNDIPKNYDCILLISILEHLEEYESVIKKCLKHCKTLIISCPYNERVSFLGLKPSEHLHSFNEKTLKHYHAKPLVEGKRITYTVNGELI